MLDAFPQLVAAICCAAASLFLWDLGGRSPDTIARDIARGFTSLRPFLSGAARLIGGLLFAYASIALLARTLRYGPASLFSVFAIGTFLAALVVDALIGDAVRRLIGIKR